MTNDLPGPVAVVRVAGTQNFDVSRRGLGFRCGPARGPAPARAVDHALV
jgi:hypothetical protein